MEKVQDIQRRIRLSSSFTTSCILDFGLPLKFYDLLVITALFIFNSHNTVRVIKNLCCCEN